MAELQAQYTFHGSIDQVFRGIACYGEYENFIPGVMKTQILPPKAPGSKCQVRYEINLVKSFHYILDMFEESPSKVSWTLSESNLMKSNVGSWTLTETATGEVLADYQVEATFRGLVPKKVTDKLAEASLPGLFSGLQKLIEHISEQS